jgi:hypothetical protein
MPCCCPSTATIANAPRTKTSIVTNFWNIIVKDPTWFGREYTIVECMIWSKETVKKKTESDLVILRPAWSSNQWSWSVVTRLAGHLDDLTLIGHGHFPLLTFKTAKERCDSLSNLGCVCRVYSENRLQRSEACRLGTRRCTRTRLWEHHGVLVSIIYAPSMEIDDTYIYYLRRRYVDYCRWGANGSLETSYHSVIYYGHIWQLVLKLETNWIGGLSLLGQTRMNCTRNCSFITALCIFWLQNYVSFDPKVCAEHSFGVIRRLLSTSRQILSSDEFANGVFREPE